MVCFSILLTNVWPGCGSVLCHVSLSVSHPLIKPNLPEAISAMSNSSPSTCMTDLTYTCVLCFYHPFPLLPSSLYLPLSVPSYTFALLTHSAACDVPSLLSLAVHRWLCPLPEFHLCPRSASASTMQPSARGPLRSRSSDRKKGPTTSVSADAISSMTQVSRWCMATSTLKWVFFGVTWSFRNHSNVLIQCFFFFKQMF